MTTLSSKTKHLLDIETGEVSEITQILVTKSDFDFDKIWVLQLATVLDLAGSKPIQILSWFLTNRNADNICIGTYEKIAGDTGASEASVKRTVKILLSAGVIAKTQVGVYRVNPDLVWRGSHHKRQAILLEYRREGGAAVTPIRRSAPKEVTKAELLAQLKALDLQSEMVREQLALFERSTG